MSSKTELHIKYTLLQSGAEDASILFLFLIKSLLLYFYSMTPKRLMQFNIILTIVLSKWICRLGKNKMSPNVYANANVYDYLISFIRQASTFSAILHLGSALYYLSKDTYSQSSQWLKSYCYQLHVFFINFIDMDNMCVKNVKSVPPLPYW